jgi:hypothetical protein
MSTPSAWLPAASEDAMTDTIRRHLEALMLPPDAQAWLIGMWQAIQVFDDFADGDTVERKDLDGVIWNTLIAMPSNPFFQKHSAQLVRRCRACWQRQRAELHVASRVLRVDPDVRPVDARTSRRNGGLRASARSLR